MRSKLIGIIILAVVAAAGCSDSPVAPSDIIGVTWKLNSITQDGAVPIVISNPDRYTLTFVDDRQLGVIADCNQCGGTYTLHDTTISITPLTCTKVACGDTSSDVAYVSALERARTIEQDGSMLVVRGDNVTLRFGR